jgi:hypothetical protein
MKKPSRIKMGVLIGLCLLINFNFPATAQTPSKKENENQKEVQMKHAKGTFEVDLTPQKPDEGVENAAVSRMLIIKNFTGGLEAKSQGQMLSFQSAVKGSAGYVAIEQVTGTLDGKQGTFVLQHNGIMDQGKPQLGISVVPDSGTGELEGLEGNMSIKIENGKHYYELVYRFK